MAASPDLHASRPEAPPAPTPARRGWLGLALILGAGLVLRTVRLGGRSYWFDEGFSRKLITFPWPEMIERVGRDNHGPLYFILLKLWAAAFGDSPWTLRFLSVLMGELTIVGMYLLAREAYWSGRENEDGADRAHGIGLLTAALVALSIFQIRWATEVRMYTLGTALAAASGWCLLRALRGPDVRVGRWLSYAIAATLFAYTHPYALFSIAAQATFALGFIAAGHGWRPGAVVRDGRFRALLLSYGALGLLWSPWLPVFLGQRRQVGASFWLPPMSWGRLARSCYLMFFPSGDTPPPTRAAAPVAVACAACFAALLRRAGPAEWFLALSGTIPVAVSAILSFSIINIFLTQYFLFAHLFFLAAIAALVSRIRARPLRRAATASVLLAFLAVAVVDARGRAARAGYPGARAAAAFLDEHRAPGEPAIVCSAMLTPCLEGHARHGAGWRTYEPPSGYRHYEGTAIIRPGEYITGREIQALPAGRVWVVDVERWEKEAPRVPIPGRWSERGEWRFPEIYGAGCEIIIREYEVPGGAG